ncbi:MAG: ribokinase [Treponema sp.]|jgi:ribokinase|nr:ribokinase [Treponema sp.]
MAQNGTIVVFGSFVTDLTSRSEGLPVPGQTILGSSFSSGPGGKGSNQAVAAHRCGAKVQMVTKVGNDVFASAVRDFYKEEGMDTSFFFTDPEKATGAALIMVDEKTGQNIIVVIGGACQNISAEEVERSRPLIESSSILLLQMEVNFDALFAVIKMAHDAGVTVVLNPAPANKIPANIMTMIDIVTPNETEAKILTGIEVKTKEDAKKAAEAFFRQGVRQVVITMGSLGAYANDGQKDELVPCLPVDVLDTTGAGDAFNGAFVTALVEGKDLFSALRYGNAGGALSTTKPGTAPAMPFRKDIDALYRKHYGA